MKAMVGCRLIDGTGRPPLDNAAVLINGDRIEAVGPRAAVALPPATEVLDLHGMTLLPGLIDCHDHVGWPKVVQFLNPRAIFDGSGQDPLFVRGYDLEHSWGLAAPRSFQHLEVGQILRDTLATGYTCVRDGGGLDVGFKQAIERRLIPGPRLVVTVTPIRGGIAAPVSGSGHRPSHDDPLLPDGIADGPVAVRSKVREMVRAGADQIKLHSTGGASSRPGLGPKDSCLGLDEIEAAVREAAVMGRKVMCHALGGVGLRAAVEAGCHSIEHGSYLGQEPELLKLMADKNIFFCPTLNVYEYHRVGALQSRPRAREMQPVHMKGVQMALAAGVKVVAGTDAGGWVHGENARELELLVEAGATPMQAIQAATGWAAECVGLEREIGTAERGKLADLVAVDGDPLRSISVLRAGAGIKLVMKGGEVFVDKREAKAAGTRKPAAAR